MSLVDQKDAKERLFWEYNTHRRVESQKADAVPEWTASSLLLHMAAELRQVSTQESGKASVMKPKISAVQNCIEARADIGNNATRIGPHRFVSMLFQNVGKPQRYRS